MSKEDTCMDDDGVVWKELPDGQRFVLFDTVGERRCVPEETWSRHDKAMMAWAVSIAVVLIAMLTMVVLYE